MVLRLVFAKSTEDEFNKLTPFECGFEAFNSARIPFSMKFYIVVIVFLIFDVEIAVLLPAPLVLRVFDIYFRFILFTVICLLIGGV